MAKRTTKTGSQVTQQSRPETRSTASRLTEPNALRSRSAKQRSYRHTFLASVIARVDFASPIPLPPKGPPRKLVDVVAEHFPIPEHRITNRRHVEISPSGTKETNKSTTEWVYHGKDREKDTCLSDDYMYVQYNKYKSYAQLRSEFLDTLNTLFETYDDLQVKRLGLRYVNKIELEENTPTDWSKHLSQDLLGAFRLADSPTTVARVFSVMDFNYGDFSLRFQYGMPNPDYPSVICKKLFILDWDVFCTLLLRKEDVAERLDLFYSKVNSAFEQVITENLRKIMRGKHDRR